MTSIMNNEFSSEDMYKLKQLVVTISNAMSFSSTSLISILVPPATQISRLTRMLNEELATAESIKQRVNRQHVVDALKTISHRVKSLKAITPRGMVIYCGTVDDDGKSQKVNYFFEPPRPVPIFIYRCDNKFHTEAIIQMFEEQDNYGFIVIDGHSTVYGLLSGNSPSVLHRLIVHLPRKHNKGGQSSVRFARQRV
eukprot:TRINITY_DN5266_c0_g1_i3.p1 TRINITY_DN5266_c0_g1~~TRINITY_DN5266_c0_g1_i3.p1  ORF type:complete len:196 (-),score=37.89 TRINITY_DN5266_c0_g1_i3:809-1396(-)